MSHMFLTSYHLGWWCHMIIIITHQITSQLELVKKDKPIYTDCYTARTATMLIIHICIYWSICTQMYCTIYLFIPICTYVCTCIYVYPVHKIIAVPNKKCVWLNKFSGSHTTRYNSDKHNEILTFKHKTNF